MKQDTIQTSFVGGELGPSLLGRTDASQYANACAIIQNWLIRPFGSIISTPGLEFVNQCVTTGSLVARLIPFMFSQSDSYMIEMGVGYFRFYTSDAIVVSPGTTPYQIAHSYAAADIPSIQYCQNKDVLYLFHNNYPPATLTRSGATNWTLANFPFTGGPFMSANITSTTLQAGSLTSGASTTLLASAPIFTVSGSTTAGHVGSFWSIGALVTNSTTGLSVQGYVQITNVTNPSTATCTVCATLSDTSADTNWAEGSWSAVRGYPGRGTFFQSRLFAARTNSEPQTVWGSRSFVFTQFDVNGGADDDALNLQLSATQGNDIKWLAPMNDLIVGTYGGEFIITSGVGTGNALTPATATVIPQTSWGSEAIPPKRIGNFVYYVQRYAQKLREISYQWTTTNYKSVDKTILSPQIAGGGFVDMAYQQNPDTVLWCVCSNGTLATMTREVDQEVQGWSRQVTQGSFISIAAIPSQSGPYDEVWVIVTRTINGQKVNYVERFVSQIVPMQGISTTPQQDQCFYVHCGLTYDGFAATSGTSISLSATSGTSVLVTSSSAYFTAGDVGLRIRSVDQYHNILGEMNITGYTSSTIVVGKVIYPFTAPTYSAGYWGVSVNQISGLSQLEAATVVVLADGGTDYPAKVVSNGTITLAYNYFVVTVGLQAIQKLMNLPQETKDEFGTAQGKKQRINNVAFKVNNSYKGFSIGGANSSLSTLSYIDSTSGSTIYVGTIPNPNFVLKEVVFRNPVTLLGTPELLYTGTIPNLTFQDDYRYGSQVIIQNNDPLPIELLSLITTIETFDQER